MKKIYIVVIFLVLLSLAAACQSNSEPTEIVETPGTATPTALQPEPATPTPTLTFTPVPPTFTPTPKYPEEGNGPTNFPEGVNPLTGLVVEDPTLLSRRPIIIKVQNLPRADRPHWGLSNADIVYEYYTEFGTTRFAAIFYGEDAEMVAPIRSARLFDFNVVRGYKGMFIFGSAYENTYNRLVNSEFANRLMIESANTAGIIFRIEPNTKNYEVADTSKVVDYTQRMGIDNSRQNLDGMFFQMQAPVGGEESDSVFVRFSGAIYNRWDYNPTSHTYTRFSDVENSGGPDDEVYERLTDRSNNKTIEIENIAIIFVRHEDIDARPTVEVLDVSLLGTGKAYIARDGKVYEVTWSRLNEQSVLTFLNADGSVFPLKPGKTWVEVITLNGKTEKQTDGNYRFTLVPEW
ncbi:MAG: hypothetical protein CVU41_08090 [Chloroflexi bacterium HGW-Chloroflexi-3]|nr:MAG: hypothetical protein CVU41_08090 [Chloroflexi bacterium HGW-Chloroflexi-3]